MRRSTRFATASACPPRRASWPSAAARPGWAWVAQVSLASRTVTRVIDVGLTGLDVAFGHGSLWAVGTVEGRRRRTASGSYPVVEVVRVDPGAGRAGAARG